MSDVPFFSLFGARDSYGLLYRLDPSLEDFVISDISGNQINQLDLVDVFLDLFKAFGIMFSKGYFLKEVSTKDVGIVQEVYEKNVHFRGKIRRFHNIRNQTSCVPSKMKDYGMMLNSFNSWKFINQINHTLDLHSGNICQVLNLVSLFSILIRQVGSLLDTEKDPMYFLENCIYKNRDKQLCPSEWSLLWSDQVISSNLSRFVYGGLMYTSESITRFLIYVLEQIKLSILQVSLGNEEKTQKSMYRQSTQKEKVLKDIDSSVQDIEHKEWGLIDSLDDPSILGEKQKFDKDQQTIKTKMSKADQTTQSLVYLLTENPLREPFFTKQVFSQVQKKDTQKYQQLLHLESEKELLLQKQDHMKKELNTSFINKKQQIQHKFREIADKITQNRNKVKTSNYSTISSLTEKINKPQFEVIKQAPKMKLDHSQNDMNNTFTYTLDYDDFEKSGLSEKSSDSSSFSEEVLETSPSKDEDGASTNFERIELDLEGLTLDLVNDLDESAELISSYRNEVKTVSVHDHPRPTDLNTELLKNEHKIQTNEELILSHQLKGQLLDDFNSSVQYKEIEKLSKINFILQLKKNLSEMSNKKHQLEVQSTKHQIIT